MSDKDARKISMCVLNVSPALQLSQLAGMLRLCETMEEDVEGEERDWSLYLTEKEPKLEHCIGRDGRVANRA